MSFENFQSNLGSARLQNRQGDYEQRLGVRPNEINLQAYNRLVTGLWQVN